MPEKLGIKEKAVLFALMAEAREVTNPELRALFGLDLVGKARHRLNDAGLVDSRTVYRNALGHELTDAGWKWCANELSAEYPQRSGSAAGALYAVLAGLRRYLERSGLVLADVFTREEEQPSAEDVEARIRATYRDLVRDPAGWVRLTELRSRLNDVPRREIDSALRRMYLTPQVDIVPESDQKTLTAADRQSAVRIGNQDKHLLWIEAT